jgi:hypothetical protein
MGQVVARGGQTLEAKGTAIRSTPVFVSQRFPARYREWLDAMSEPARQIVSNPILVNQWYPLRDAFVEPTRAMCDLFFDGRLAGAWEAGRFSADLALKGLLKLFVKVGTPSFLMSRTSVLFSLYYRPMEAHLEEGGSRRAVIQVTRFADPHAAVEHRMGGWMQRALEINGCKEVRLEVTRSLARGDALTEFVGTWA